MHNLMIDIETVGTNPDAPILSIGAVKFDPETGKHGREFYAAIRPTDAFKYGTPDGSTFAWWMGQSDPARKSAVGGKNSLTQALEDLRGMYRDWKDVKVWGNGPSFDMTILEHGFRAVGSEAPWAFWNIRCCRTVAQLSGRWPPKIGGKGVHHNALDDAKHQADWVSSMWQGLRNTKAPVVAEDDLFGDL